MGRAIYTFFLGLFFLAGCGAIETLPFKELAKAPGGVTTHFLYSTSGGTAEGYLSRPKGSGPFPLMILLHGHSFRAMGAERIIPAAEAFAGELCYASLAVSLPGYGQTEVQAGTDPEITLTVVLDAIMQTKKLPWIDSKRVFLYGFSRGGLFTSMLVNRIDGVRGVVLHSGAYDLDRLFRDTPNQWLRRMLNPHGDPNPKLYSVIPEVPTWHAPTLILHGNEDTLIPPSQALLLRDALEAEKKPYRLVLFPKNGHRLPLDEVWQNAISFLKDNAGSACAVSAP